MHVTSNKGKDSIRGNTPILLLLSYDLGIRTMAGYGKIFFVE